MRGFYDFRPQSLIAFIESFQCKHSKYVLHARTYRMNISHDFEPDHYGFFNFVYHGMHIGII